MPSEFGVPADLDVTLLAAVDIVDVDHVIANGRGRVELPAAMRTKICLLLFETSLQLVFNFQIELTLRKKSGRSDGSVLAINRNINSSGFVVVLRCFLELFSLQDYTSPLFFDLFFSLSQIKSSCLLLSS